MEHIKKNDEFINEGLSVKDITNFDPNKYYSVIELRFENLTSLEGSPRVVKYFDVSHNQLKNLICGPEMVERYHAYDNQLETLEGSPRVVEYFDVSNNQLKNLICGPEKVERYYAFHNQLKTLEGSPREVELINVSNNQLKNLIGGPQKVKKYYAFHNQLETLEGSPKVVERFDIAYIPMLKNTNGIPTIIYDMLILDGTIHSASQFTEYPYYVGKILFDNEISIEDIKEIVSNIREVGYIIIGNKEYTKDEILRMNK